MSEDKTRSLKSRDLFSSPFSTTTNTTKRSTSNHSKPSTSSNRTVKAVVHQCCSLGLSSSLTSKASITSTTESYQFGRHARNRAEFHAAMMLTENACSDIMEEAESSASVGQHVKNEKINDSEV